MSALKILPPIAIPPRLSAFLSHQSVSYHVDSLESSSETISQSLSTWYLASRRKLPWRGDPEPFDGWNGSGTLDGSALNSDSKKKKASSQKSISSFFTPAAPKPSPAPPPTPRAAAMMITPYHVWISEIMLQQTRVAAVIPFYTKWIARFPTVSHLASASEEDVNAHWAGLGFYRRAKHLHNGSKYIIENCKDDDGEVVFPNTVEGLLKVPGIGPYTAGAISSICFKIRTPAVDGNVLRVWSRCTTVCANVKGKYGGPWSQVLGQGIYKNCPEAVEPGILNQAIMELGATYCQNQGSGIDSSDPLKEVYGTTKIAKDVFTYLKSNGSAQSLRDLASTCKCEICCESPDSNGVLAFLDLIIDAVEKNDNSLDDVKSIAHRALPLEPPKKGKRDEIHHVAVLENEKGEFLMGKREEDGLLAGQWEFPSICVKVLLAKDGGGKGKVFTQDKISDGEITEILNSYLGGLIGKEQVQPRKKLDPPLVHIFTHIRHFMNLEVGKTDATEIMKSEVDVDVLDGVTIHPYESYEFLSRDDMKARGVTSAIKKVSKLLDKGGKGKRKNEGGGDSPTPTKKKVVNKEEEV
ncbi:hypothetical protein TrLO_g10702 [Triparma laevis f. longispina]|uniref:Adenine DNA glycosylase n=2 Tax=Triparma laevis TaxID=1534972 RepID=A0A9W7CCE4_9STRA|nr:hypothetical protein TrLO_g10702 [Triparma laevis f. longispina]